MKFVTDMLLSLHSCSPCWQVDVFCELCEFLGTRSQRGCYTTGKSKASFANLINYLFYKIVALERRGKKEKNRIEQEA